MNQVALHDVQGQATNISKFVEILKCWSYITAGYPILEACSIIRIIRLYVAINDTICAFEQLSVSF